MSNPLISRTGSARQGGTLEDPEDPPPSSSKKETRAGQVPHQYYNASHTTMSSRMYNDVPRLVHRNLPFHQSRNRMLVKNNKPWLVWEISRHDFFHVLLSWPTHVSLLCLMLVWTGMILIFAGIYVFVDNATSQAACGLGAANDPISFPGAFAFSLETCTTVGYGLPNSVNAYFERPCGSVQFVIYLQMLWSMIFNALLLAFLYSRLAKVDNRGAQVVMSNQAIVTVVDGQMRLLIRCYDLDARHPVVEAHVRLYVVMQARPVPRQLRVIQPNDELGGQLFLSVPNVVVHHIDFYSLIHPPLEPNSDIPGILPNAWGLNLRQVDSWTCSREELACPVCSTTFGTVDRWIRHVRFQQMAERKDNYPVQGTHLELTDEYLQRIQDFHSITDPAQAVAAVREYFHSTISEVICVVEGIDPLTSGTFQGLQSYRYDDIVFDANAEFMPCLETISVGSCHQRYQKSMMRINLDRFHEIRTVPPDRVQQQQQQVKQGQQYEELKMINGDGLSTAVGVTESRKQYPFPQMSVRTHDGWLDK